MTKRVAWKHFLPGLGLLPLACLGPDSHVTEMTLLPYMTTCEAFYPTQCMVAAEKGDTSFFFHQEIKGFVFEWGVRQTIRVRVTEVEKPMADGASVAYKLLKVMERTSGFTADFWVQAGSFREADVSGDTLWIGGYSRPILKIGSGDSALIAGRGKTDFIKVHVAMDSAGGLTAVEVLKLP